MQLVTEFPQFEEGPSTRRVKSRGKACLHCRRRKMRCDGIKPSCFQCIRAERGGECEYDDGITKTGTQMLYERLAILEKRFRDLQAAKRPAHPRRAPSYPRSDADANANTNVNLARSNSAPERAYCRPRTSGNSSYEQCPSGASGNRRDTCQSLSFNSYALGFSGTGPDIVPMDGMENVPYLQPFDTSRASLSSRSSPHSGRSTPSSSDLSHNEVAFHPRYAFSNGVQQSAVLQAPSIASMGTEMNVGYPYDDMLQMEMAVPQPGMHTENLPGNSGVPHSFLPDLSSPDLDGEMAPAIMEHLVDNFIAHSQQAGVTMLSSSLMDLSCISNASLSSSASCLMDCVFLWGALFSPIKPLHARKEHFLHRALAALPSLLSAPLAVAPEFQLAGSGCTPGTNHQGLRSAADGRYNVMVAIAASTMLATYFFAEGRALEGSYHANTASQLAICTGLHHTPDPRLWQNTDSSSGFHTDSTEYGSGSGAGQMPSSPRTAQPASSGAELLPPPSSQNHSLERHHLFWNVFVLDRGWSAAGRLPAPSSRWSAGARDASGTGEVLKEKDPRTAIATPWPEDFDPLVIEDHMGHRPMPPQMSSRSPVEDFLTGADVRPTQSVLQLRAKSTALFEAASRIASLRDPYEPGSCYDTSFAFLQRTLSIFLKTLLPLSAHDFRPPSLAKCALYTTHTLTHAAVVHLHLRLAGKAYKEGFVDRPTAMLTHMGIPPGRGVQTVIDGLLGYERVFSQHGIRGANANSGQSQRSVGGRAGIACAAVDNCFSSAREIVRIASYIMPDDFAFLEPIIAPCWALAGEVLLRELERLPVDSQSTDKVNLLSDIRILETSLKYLGVVFPIGNIEAQKIASAMNTLVTGSTPIMV